MDVIANFLTILRNGIMASKPFVIAPSSRICLEIVEILRTEGFVKNYAVSNNTDGFKSLKIFLKYVDGEPAIHEIKRVSKASVRQYVGVDSVKPVIGGLGVSILSTNKGIISHKKAKQLRVGGEILCTVW